MDALLRELSAACDQLRGQHVAAQLGHLHVRIRDPAWLIELLEAAGAEIRRQREENDALHHALRVASASFTVPR